MKRKHRHLLEIAMILWGECVHYATYLINHVPLSSLNGTTPYEKLFSHTPSFDNFPLPNPEPFP